MLAQVLRSTIFLIAVGSLLAASVEEENLEMLDAEFDVTDGGDEVEQAEKLSFDNETIQEG